MKVKELKELLQGVDDEMDVLIPMNAEFDGYFKPPCIAESGVLELCINENLGTSQESFLLVPHGFFDETDGIEPELN